MNIRVSEEDQVVTPQAVKNSKGTLLASLRDRKVQCEHKVVWGQFQHTKEEI